MDMYSITAVVTRDDVFERKASVKFQIRQEKATLFIFISI